MCRRNGEHQFHPDETDPISLLMYDVHIIILVEMTPHLFRMKPL
jgi:hypothetical protein